MFDSMIRFAINLVFFSWHIQEPPTELPLRLKDAKQTSDLQTIISLVFVVHKPEDIPIALSLPVLL